MPKTVKCRLKTSLLEWWQLIPEKRCDVYAHSQEDEYNEALKVFVTIKMNAKTLDLQKPNPRR
jgi:hypothetical protein